jgi:hypothetical protein
MLDELCDYIRRGLFKFPTIETHRLIDYKAALEKATAPYSGKKQVFDMS